MLREAMNTELPERRILSVGIILANSFTLSALSLFVDSLRLAADEGDRSRQLKCHWSIMANRPDPVLSSCGATVGRTSPLTDPKKFDYIVVIGGLLHAGRQVDEATTDYLKYAAKIGVPLIGICTGSFILARSGLMVGRRCCVSWYHYQDFLREFPNHDVVADRMFVVDGDRITCCGGGGAADLATHIVERKLGRAVAQKVRHILLLSNARQGGEPQPHPPLLDFTQGVSDRRLRRGLLMMEQHIAEPMPIAQMAEHLNLSTRQLERLFRNAVGARPSTVYRVFRLRYARWLLDHTEQSVTDIALEAGFSDCAHFSRQFKAAFGTNPSDIRNGRPKVESKVSFRETTLQQLATRLFN